MSKLPHIKLHFKSDNTCIILNANNIRAIINGDGSGSFIYSSEDEKFWTNESPSKIISLISECDENLRADFIKCHGHSTNSIGYFNARSIELICTKKNVTTIVINKKLHLCVNESPETLYNLMNQPIKTEKK